MAISRWREAGWRELAQAFLARIATIALSGASAVLASQCGAATTPGGSADASYDVSGSSSSGGASGSGSGSGAGSSSSGGSNGSSGSGSNSSSSGAGGSSGGPCAVCTLYCPYGMVAGPNGCPLCQCNPTPDAGNGADGGAPCGIDGGACCPNTVNRLPCDPGLMCCQGVPYPPNGACHAACNLRSDRALKRDIEPVDEQAVLDAVARMPISTWSYRSENPSVRHMGPMAQDFKAAFDLGDSDKTYSAIDAHGVTFAAIQALRERLEEQNARLERLERENAELRECAAPLAYGHVTNACEQAPKSTDR